MASVVTLLCGYPLWAGEKAIGKVAASTKFVPTIAEIKPELEDQVRVHRYAAEWEQGAQHARLEAQKRIAGPVTPRPTYEELKAKYGPNWGISNPDKKTPPTKDECRQKLIAQIGQDAFDAIPDTGHDMKTWAKLRAPQIDEAAE